MPATLNTMHEPDAVTAKAAALLKAEYLCGREIAQAVETLQKTLLESTSGKGVREEAKALEVLLQKLAKIGQHTDAFLHAARKDSLAAVLAAAPPSPPREKALLLASRAAEQQHALKSSLAAAQGLLEKSRGFIEFHVNLLNQTVASDTYAPPGGSGSESELRRGRRMFDANI